jgi:hypothetical protein
MAHPVVGFSRVLTSCWHGGSPGRDCPGSIIAGLLAALVEDINTPDHLWEWINDRDNDHYKQPSVAEQFDTLLRVITGHSCTRVAPSEITRENNSVTYVFAFTNFYCARVDSNPATHALRHGTKVATVRSVRESCPTHVSDFIVLLVRKEDSNKRTKHLY